MSHKLCKQNISRLMALLLACLLVLSLAPAAFAAGGSCGSSLQWSLSGGTLTISGSGAMTNYGDGNLPPWFDQRDQITRISLPEGLTHIGSAAFYGCAISTAAIPGTVETIGELAFSNCASMTALTLKRGLQSIGDNAFEKCASLLELRVPDTVYSIGHHAFYFCTSLSYVSIPGSVQEFGSGIFSYCHALTQADISVRADLLPSWTFYGCDQLTVVNTREGSVSASSMKVASTPNSAQPEPVPNPVPNPTVSPIPNPVPNPTVSPTPNPAPNPTPNPEPNANTSTEVINGNTTVTTQNTTTPSGENITSSTVVKTSEDSTTVDKTITTQSDDTTTVQKEIISTVVTPEGWNDVLQQVESSHGNSSDNQSEATNVTVYDTQSNVITKDILQGFAGEDVTLIVQTQNGTQFKLNCLQLPEKVKKDLELSYTLVPAGQIPEGMEGCTVYQLTFEKSADYQVEMIMRLPGDHGYQTATLYRMDKKEPIQLQSVMVDEQSNAHWYLRSIDHKQEYLIGINIPGATTESPIIPAELAGIHKVANVYDGVEYVVTGRSSSWNMGLGRVMAILAAVMVTAIVVIGFVMYTLNRRRLKNGYMPDWSDDDEE